METRVRKFQELTTEELYEILRLRTEVFVVEQGCAYQEVDGHDVSSQHMMVYDKDELVSYARLVPPGDIYTEPSIGRVVVKKTSRNSGHGRIIFQQAIEEITKLYPAHPIKIQAQVYLEEFYRGFGFETVSKPYPDVGIWHVDMIRIQ